jgi:hypothetical protein
MTLYLRVKFETNIPRNETVRPRSQFLHSCIYAQFIYSHDINCSQIHECGNWELGNAASLLGIHKSDLLCSAGIIRSQKFSKFNNFMFNLQVWFGFYLGKDGIYTVKNLTKFVFGKLLTPHFLKAASQINRRHIV